MNIETYTPSPPLLNHIETFWYYYSNGTEPYLERMLPDANISVVINLTDHPMRLGNLPVSQPLNEYRTAIVRGVPRRYFIVDQQADEAVIGVHFRPGGAYAFFQEPLGELRDRTVDLDALWGGAVSGIRDRLLEAPTIADRFRVLEAILMEHLINARLSHPAVQYALHTFDTSPTNMGIAQTSNSIGISQRRFTDLFQREVGVTPKSYCRTQRFAGAVERLGQSPVAPLVDIALDCGYFDQAHFTHEFRELSGLPPAKFQQRLQSQTSHLWTE